MRNQNFAIKREQRKFIYSAEREQSQDRKAGLKEKGESRKEKGESRILFFIVQILFCCFYA